MTSTVRVTREAVAREALTMIRSDGVAALTMRGLATRLSIQAPSLYEHVLSKEHLLDLVAKDAFTEFESNAAAYSQVATLDAWIELVIDGSLQLRDFYLRHPGLAALMQRKLDPKRDEFDGSRARLVRAQLDALGRLGVPDSVARPVFDIAVFWSLAAIAAEGLTEGDVTSREREQRYRRGLELLMRGVRTALEGV